VARLSSAKAATAVRIRPGPQKSPYYRGIFCFTHTSTHGFDSLSYLGTSYTNSAISLKKLIFLHEMPIDMSKKAINRLKAVLAEEGKTNKWLAEKLDKNETTISRWCTNEVQPSMDNFVTIARLLAVDVRELINSTKISK
jgi:putative transcriptional regulator